MQRPSLKRSRFAGDAPVWAGGTPDRRLQKSSCFALVLLVRTSSSTVIYNEDL